VGQVDTGEGPHWRAGGILIQNIAEDDARGETGEAWTRAQAFFETVGEDELIDPTISAATLLWRLYHEDGVRLFRATPVTGFCRCSEERIVSVLASFPPEERAGMVEEDGRIRVTCEYCSRIYDLAPEAVE
jgi:molecular chaperone Hsp33